MVKYRLKQLIAEKEFKEGIRLSLSELSSTLGISRNTISKMANNKPVNPQIETIEKICRFFQCDTNDLIVIVSDDETD